ncbi:Short-chain dehydrogenase/reductase SDR [Ceratobasidium theobromae]|uniref:Short-chain dehydrogenase/reductase SDR n=1 Tax=Ceratobasidium theobromae TaxID=1582974 RepID=A0A5N5QTD4_9AGAM|nr:Short-chain dehydrogenase/reductase SDR [Ceratobasidium theobromae]
MASHTQGKVAIVTGASSGIGKTTAITLSKAGYRVVLVARREPELKATAQDCPTDSLVVAGDVTDEAFATRVFGECVKKFGRVDVLFNNAGISAPAVPLEELSVKDFKAVIDVNLISAFIFTREAFKVFKNQTPQGGRIINNGSIAAHAPRPMSAPYTTSKHAITGLTKSTSLDGRNFNIACTQIDIGMIPAKSISPFQFEYSNNWSNLYRKRPNADGQQSWATGSSAAKWRKNY